MVIESRRDLLRGLALGLGVVSCRAAWGQPAEGAAYVGIETAASDGLSTASFFAADGGRLGRVPLDFRAHGLAEYGSRIVVFPRRPGDRFAVIDRETLEIRRIVTAPTGRHFFGHGAFTMDGKHLLVTENDLETLTGSVAIYDLDAGKRLDRIDLPDAGPHEIVRHPTRDRFFVAIGGLETHPAYGRTPLNLHDFRSQIVTLDATSGGLTTMGYWPGTEGISLRHLAVDGQDRLYVGGQIADRDRAKSETVVWVVDKGDAAQIDLGAAMGGYVSSVAASGSEALVTSKEGNLAITLNGDALIGSQTLDGAGAAALGHDLRVAAGYTLLTINGVQIPAAEGAEFDNHGLSLL